MKRIAPILIIILSIFYVDCFAQKTQTDKRVPMRYIIENGDTIYHADIEAIIVPSKRKFKRKRDWKKYYRMVYNLPKAYPYAIIAKNKLAEMNAHFEKIKSKSERKAYIKVVEREMKKQFEKPLKNLTRSQGKLLIKLFYRETGSTAYSMVKELKGGVAAFFWQSLASLFGASLKAEYDKNGDDAMLEELVQTYEHGNYNQLYFSVFGMTPEQHEKYLINRRKKKK